MISWLIREIPEYYSTFSSDFWLSEIMEVHHIFWVSYEGFLTSLPKAHISAVTSSKVSWTFFGVFKTLVTLKLNLVSSWITIYLVLSVVIKATGKLYSLYFTMFHSVPPDGCERRIWQNASYSAPIYQRVCLTLGSDIFSLLILDNGCKFFFCWIFCKQVMSQNSASKSSF